MTEITDSKQVYETVRDFISHRTVGHEHQRAIRESELKTSLCANGPIPAANAETALRKLADDDVIIRGEGWVTIDTTEDTWYQQVIEWCAAREDPPRGLIGACNRRLQA